jgi:hypothetical protein
MRNSGVRVSFQVDVEFDAAIWDIQKMKQQSSFVAVA